MGFKEFFRYVLVNEEYLRYNLANEEYLRYISVNKEYHLYISVNVGASSPRILTNTSNQQMPT